MTAPRNLVRITIIATVAVCVALVLVASGRESKDPSALYAKTFDTHWERLRDNYPFFELYSVDWGEERAEHRPRALAAANPDEFAWELARLISALPDPHVSFMPAMDTIKGRWAYPELDTRLIGRRPYVLAWLKGQRPEIPEQYIDAPHAYPEIISIRGERLSGAAEILAAGPLGTTFDITLRWPDGSETNYVLRRPDVSNLPPPTKHFGEGWLVTGRVGSIGYMHVKTFDPTLGTLGPEGKITTMLRAALKELHDTDGLILDFQGNGGGLVAASDPFLGNILERRLSYRWGNSDGQTRVITPRKPRYPGDIVTIVDERSASGGEWAARILRDAGRAVVVGGTTAGAEAAVHTSTGPDGSVVNFSAWPMVEPGIQPFQGTGIELDHALPLTIEAVRAHGLDQALANVLRARLAKALELLGAREGDLGALVALADE